MVNVIGLYFQKQKDRIRNRAIGVIGVDDNGGWEERKRKWGIRASALLQSIL